MPLLTFAAEEARYYLSAVRYRLNPAWRDRRRILVNGVPKSGTTWLYRMILAVPGYQERGNFRGDISLYDSVQPGNVVHGHDWYTAELNQKLSEANIKVVLVTRDLRDQTVSRMFHLKRDQTHAWQPTIEPLNNDEALMLSIEGREAGNDLPLLPGVEAWKTFTRQWLAADINIVYLRYEDLVAEPIKEMGRVFNNLDLPVPRSLLQAIVERNRFERLTVGHKFWQSARRPGQEDAASHFRKGITGDWQNFFNEAHRQRFKELAGDWLVEMGYETGMDW